MSTLLLTSSPPSWKPLTDITTATMRKYCERHGYDFHHDQSDTKMRAHSAIAKLSEPDAWVPLKYFVKFQLLDHFLNEEACRKNYDTVAWIDSDCVVTNYNRGLHEWPGDVATAFDMNAVHPTVIIVRKKWQTLSFIWACNNIGRSLFGHHEWSDNECLRYFSATPPYQGIVDYYSAGEMCAMTPGLYPIPAVVRGPFEWTPESWTLHLSALSLEKRVEIAQHYVEKLGLL